MKIQWKPLVAMLLKPVGWLASQIGVMMRSLAGISLKLAVWLGALLAVIALGGYAAYLRWTLGLSVTNLTDYYPWGLWVGVDVLSGVALAGGAFVVATAVYLMGVERFHPIARPAVLTGLLGYLMVMVALVVDVGQPERFWHPLVFWQPHSIMWEVVWCVTLYTTVLTFEFLPAVGAKIPFLPKRLPSIVILSLATAGAILSTLHQSSLGSVFLIAPFKMNPLWQTSFLPVLFFLSAVGGGLSMLILESILSAKAMGRGLERQALEIIPQIAGFVLELYLAIRLFEIVYRNTWFYIMLDPWRLPFAVELTLFLGATLIFAIPRLRRSVWGLLVGGLAGVAAVVANRWNVSITSMQIPNFAYTPSWVEWAFTAGIVAFALLLYTIAVKLFPIFPPETEEHHAR